MNPEQVTSNLWCFRDTCNVYVIRHGDCAVAIDFGCGKWLDRLGELGIRSLEHVFLTHHHADQCRGLRELAPSFPFTVHAAVGEKAYFEPEPGQLNGQGRGCPASYSVLPRGLAGVTYDVSASGTMLIDDLAIRVVSTPGHTPAAVTYLADVDDRLIAFCGDAVHAGGTLWQPFHLEWNHWSREGALAAHDGLQQLVNYPLDVVAPAHGPVIDENASQVVASLREKLHRLTLCKTCAVPGEPDRYVAPRRILPCGARKYSANLYQIGGSGYVLRSMHDEVLAIDVDAEGAMPELAALLHALGLRNVTAALVTHHHSDHSNGLNALHRAYNAPLLVPAPMQPLLRDLDHYGVPFLPAEPVVDGVEELPEQGAWLWNEYTFEIAHTPGQTWWHYSFCTTIDGMRVAFTGDNLQPASKWNATGGFCAYNRSRLVDGYGAVARLLDRWQPQLIAAGHRSVFRYHPDYTRKMAAWAAETDTVLRDLCPTGSLESDYYAINRNKPTESRGVFLWR